MLLLETRPVGHGVWGNELEVPGRTSIEVGYHVNLLGQAGLIEFEPVLTENKRIIKCLVFSLSWSGHEYLDAIRDPDVWKKTKEGARRVGSAGLDLLVEIAKSIVRSKVREVTGLEL